MNIDEASDEFKKVVDGFSNALRDCRKGYHLTLGEAIETLTGCQPRAVCEFDGGKPVGLLASYRGYYADLAFASPKHSTTHVQDVLAEMQRAINTSFRGYKGGDYFMGAGTPLWAAEYGDTSGIAVVSIQILNEYKIIFNTKPVFD